jgi:hypothetical protein
MPFPTSLRRSLSSSFPERTVDSHRAKRNEEDETDHVERAADPHQSADGKDHQPNQREEAEANDPGIAMRPALYENLAESVIGFVGHSVSATR